jgi:hypothetical protein
MDRLNIHSHRAVVVVEGLKKRFVGIDFRELLN